MLVYVMPMLKSKIKNNFIVKKRFLKKIQGLKNNEVRWEYQ